MNGRFQSGDVRINRSGRPKKQRISDAIGGAISATDVEKIVGRMKVLALAGDPAAAQAVAAFVAASGAKPA